MSTITLKNMHFHAYHGCLDHEKQLGNSFIVTLRMELDTTTAGQTDKLEDTLNYQLVYDAVRAEMEIPSELIEHAGQRIFDHIYNKFQQIKHLELELIKLNPPLGGPVDHVSIEIKGKRA